MKVDFHIKQRFAGFSAESATGGSLCTVIPTESLTSHDGALLTWRLEGLQQGIFSEIPNLPPPSLIDNILIIIRQDLTATAYVDELRPRALLRPTRDINAGEALAVNDIADISSFDLGVEIPDDAGFILVRSYGWRRSLFYDVRPLHPGASLRDFDIRVVLARQALDLYKRPFSTLEESDVPKKEPEALERGMGEGLAALTRLLEARCDDESKYQELLNDHAWIFGGYYSSLISHPKFNDENIPDFAALRHQDGHYDIIEIKHPFLPCFRQSGGFTADFNDAWNQAERYLVFARKNADYLRREKSLPMENPRCLLIMGYRFNQEQLRAIRDKETCNLAINVISYDQLAAMAQALAGLLGKS